MAPQGCLWQARRTLRRWRGYSKVRSDDDAEIGQPRQKSQATGSIAKAPAWLAIFRLARPFFSDPHTRVRAIGLSIGVLLLLGAESAILVYYSEVQKKYMTALQQKQADGFYIGLWKVARLLMMILPIIGCHNYLQRALDTEWRAAVTRGFAKAYLCGSSQCPAFYSMHLEGSVDNPDQRICQDTAALVSSSISLLVDSCGSAFRVLGFIGVLFRISPACCIAIVCYVSVSTSVAVFGFGPWIFKYKQLCTKQEATLRYCLIRVRENAESVAFFRGGFSEWLRYERLFTQLVQTIYRSSAVASVFAVFQHSIQYATFAVPALMVGPAYLRGDVEFGAISQAQFAFHMIFGGLMLILDKLQDFSGLAVQVSRLRDLEEAIQQPDGSSSLDEAIVFQEFSALDEQVLALEDMTLMTPARRGCLQHTLVQHLTFQLSGGQSMLIVGSSGIGKSSLLRGIAGLWTSGSGSVQRCTGSDVFFMPQRPYMYPGTLREQLLYPDIERTDVTSDTLQDLLRDVNLEYVFDRYSLNETQEWSNILSLGEQQRVNFARMLLRPALRLALIDEGTSACDPQNEAYLYELLSRRKHSFVSVGHRPNLRQYHTHALWLQHSKNGVGAGGTLSTSSGHASNPASALFLSMRDFEKVGPVC